VGGGIIATTRKGTNEYSNFSPKNDRKINGAFAICGYKKDFETIINCLKEAVAQENYFGWVDICEKTEPLANTAPLAWEEREDE